MLTSYMVTCPHLGCDWHGSLIPRKKNVEAWRGPAGNRPIVQFECPQCHGEWQGRVVGDDVQPLPLELATPLA